MPIPAAAPIIDMDVIAELRGIGGDGAGVLLRRVLVLFADRAPPALGAVTALAQGDDLAALADAVHQLKSMCASIGAARAFSACHELERLARRGDAFDAAAMTARVSSELVLALRRAEELLAS